MDLQGYAHFTAKMGMPFLCQTMRSVICMYITSWNRCLLKLMLVRQLNFFLAYSDFRLLITFANSLDTDQDWQNWSIQRMRWWFWTTQVSQVVRECDQCLLASLPASMLACPTLFHLSPRACLPATRLHCSLLKHDLFRMSILYSC